MASFLKTLDLERDADCLLKYWGVTDEKKRELWQKMERRIKDAYREAAKRCRQSLAFKDMAVREGFIARPENQTCQWIYRDPQYKMWVTGHKPLLWIQGNPGSGKSILMKSLFNQRKRILEGSSTILLRFFFNGRGSNIERSREALYRTLLYSFTGVNQFLLCNVLALYLEKETRGHTVRWQPMELADIVHDELERFRSSDVEILIDALDECSDAEVLAVVRRFEKSIQDPRNQNALGVCWSSRFDPAISLTSLQGIKLVVNGNRNGDIREYIQRNFPMNLHESLRSIGEHIISRAEGIFLWASLVADKLIKAFHAGDSANQLEAMLRGIPDGLDNYFLQIFKESGFTTEQRKDLQQIALLVLGASRPLSVDELYDALLLENPSRDWSFDDITGATQQFEKRLTHASGGLIEVVGTKFHASRGPIKIVDKKRLSSPSDRTTRVQVIHESVREFFLGKGLSILQVSSRESFLTICHSGITRAGFICLSKVANDLNLTKRYQGNERFPVNDVTLNSLIPQESWHPPPIQFLVNYVQDHIFAHFDHVRCASVDEGWTTLWRPPASLCREALYAYLRICCFEVIQYGGLTKSMNQQLRIVSKHAEAFELDTQAFVDRLDLPNRLMAASEFLKRKGIYLFEGVSSINHQGQSMHRFLATFSASFHHLLSDSPRLEASTPVPDKNPTATTYGNSSPSGRTPDSFSFLFGISFIVPTSIAPRLMIEHRLLSNLYTMRRDTSFPVDIDDWQVVSVVDPELQSLLAKSQPRGQLTLSTPSASACSLFHWNSVQDASSTSEAEPSFVQAGKCALRWQTASDRETLFERLEQQVTWAEAGNSHAGEQGESNAHLSLLEPWLSMEQRRTRPQLSHPHLSNYQAHYNPQHSSYVDEIYSEMGTRLAQSTDTNPHNLSDSYLER